MPRSAIVNGALPLTISVAGTEPTPMNTRKAVPMTSAASFCLIDGSSIAFTLLSRVAAEPTDSRSYLISTIIR